MTRREWIFNGSALILAASAGIPDQEGSILARIRQPVFPKRDFDIRKFGAKPDGQTACTQAIADTIASCSQAGGGRVVIPAGKFLTGPIHLESRVHLYVSEGATLLFSSNPRDYLPVVFTRFESTECMNYSPLIYAFEKEDIAVTGPGTLDGQADESHWWPWKKATGPQDDRKALVEMSSNNIPVAQRVFGDGHTLRPNFIQPYRCKNVLLEGFKMVNSPMWELNPVLCSNVTMRGIRIDSHGPNNDGCDPECCADVLIEGCTFSTGDDCIAIKSGRNEDGRRINVPCSNIIIRRCNMQDGHGGVSIGSEVSGGVQNVFISNCRMSSPNLQRGLRIKTNSYRGGVIQNVHFANVTIGQVVQAAVEVDFFYEEGQGGPFKPVVHDIFISNVSSQKSKYGVFLRGFDNASITGVHLAHCRFENAAKGNLLEHVAEVESNDVVVNGKPLT